MKLGLGLRLGLGLSLGFGIQMPRAVLARARGRGG